MGKMTLDGPWNHFGCYGDGTDVSEFPHVDVASAE